MGEAVNEMATDALGMRWVDFHRAVLVCYDHHLMGEEVLVDFSNIKPFICVDAEFFHAW
jgi:hypothetical protein